MSKQTELKNMYIKQIEALLFVAGEEGLNLKELSQLLQLNLDQTADLLQDYELLLNERIYSGLTLIQTADQYKLATKKELAPLISDYAQAPFNQSLTKPVLETLAIIAYRQPITRVEIEDVRGVQVASNLQKLRLHDLIETCGRLEQPGRPLLYRTTAYFLDYFGINSLEELPDLPPIEQEEQLDLFFGDQDE